MLNDVGLKIKRSKDRLQADRLEQVRQRSFSYCTGAMRIVTERALMRLSLICIVEYLQERKRKDTRRDLLPS